MSFLFKKKEDPMEKWINPEEKCAELALDIYETDNSLVLISPIAGAKDEELEVSVEKDMLIIKGRRAEPFAEENPQKKYICKECYWGGFMKRIILPDDVDINKIQAALKNGLLTLKIPKFPKEHEPNKIKIARED